MNKITFPLGPGPLPGPTVGPAVADLQDALLLCLARNALLATNEGLRREFWTTLLPEREKQNYGNTTGRLVNTFQSERNLQASGGVDEATANALNALLTEWGLLDQPTAQSFVVSGQVRREDGLPLRGMRVRAVHEADAGSVRLGEDTTDAEGRYTIRYEPVPGIDGINLRMTVFDADGKPLHDSDVIREAKPLEIVDLVVPDVDSTPSFVVKGEVRQANGEIYAGAAVRAYNKNLRSEDLLGETTTDTAGHYEIRYSAEQFRHSNEKEADLIVRVFDDAGNVLVASPVFFDAPPEQTIDLMVGGGTYRGPSEYEQFVVAIMPLLDGVQPADLNDDDVSFLAGETKLSGTYIAYFARANNLAQGTNVPPEAFYGFFREGLPAELPSLLAQKPESLRRALEQALADNIVPLKLSTQLDDILKQLQQLVAAQAFNPPDQTGGASLGSLLSVTLAEKALQEKFLTLYVQHQGPIENFWQSLAQELEFQGNTVPQLQLTIQVGAITRNHVPLVQALQQNGTVQTVKDLAKLDESDWRALLNTQVNGQVVGFPVDAPGNSDDEKAANYAHTLARTVEEIIPSAVVAHRMGQDDVPGKADLVTFFTNSPDFDFVTTHIDSYLAEKGSTALRGVQDVKTVTEQLKGYQRVFNVSHRYDEMRLLQTNGINSALQISGLGRDNFIAQYDSLLEQGQAAAIFGRADYLSAKALNVYGTYSAATNKVALPLVLDPLTAMTRSNSFRAEVLEESGPNLTTFFGTQDFCNCDDCRSMYSQAAYLVEILSFLAPDAQTNLLAATRRPDLGEIELSCSNTTTLLPQIDLVNEVLERAVTVNAGGTLPPSGSWPQTTWTADELSANPEHQDEHAYSVLAQAIYSWNLPFDLAAEEARAYLSQLGIRRDQLMKTFQKRPQGTAFDPTELDIAGEYLHLCALEQHIITATPVAKATVRAATTGPVTLAGLQTVDGVALADGDRVLVKDQNVTAEDGIYLARNGVWDPAADGDTGAGVIVTVNEGTQNKGDKQFLPQPWQFWFRDDTNQAHSTNWPAVLEPVPVFLQQSGLTYQELLDLLKTTFINPGNTPQSFIQIEFQADQDGNATCDLQSATLKNLSPTAVDRLHRFVRLQRKLGWSARDLDRTISALQVSDITPDFLLQLAYIQQFSSLGVSLMELLTWWAPIDTTPGYDGSPSFYEQLFQNKTVARIEPDDAFNLNAPGNPQLKDHIPGIIAALGINASDLALLLDGAVAQQVLHLPAPEVADPALNLANLSHLYRIVSLARALKLSIAEFLSLKALSGLNPFDPQHMEDTQRFVDNALQLQASSFSITDLDYLLRNVFQPGGGVVPTDESITILLQQLQSELQKIFTDTISSPDPTGVITRQKLAIVLASDLLDRAMAVIAGTVDDPSFIDTYFKDFLDVQDAKQNLGSGPGALQTREERFQYVLDHLMAYLSTTSSERFVLQKLSEMLKLNVATMPVLLQQIISSPRTPPDPQRMALAEFLDDGFVNATQPLDIQIMTYKKVDKAATVIKKFKVSSDELTFTLPAHTSPWFVERGPSLGWLNLDALPTTAMDGGQPLFDGWRRLLDFFTFRSKLSAGNPSLFEILEGAISFTQIGDSNAVQSAVNTYIEQLSTRMARPPQDLQALIGINGALGLNFPNDYKDERIFVRLRACFVLIQRLGVATQQVLPWIAPLISLSESRNSIKAVKAKYADDQWLAVTRPLRDTLREQQRDALVAYLISQNQTPTFSDSKAVSDHLLMYVEMSSCQATTRIAQAISSVQLFIQRALMNLEQGIVISTDDATHWTTWMQNYRISQANLEVFLYPWNWIDPDLRDDKTPFFKDFENELVQGEITDARAEEAFMHYLEKLDTVARLEVAGMYHQQEPEANIDILHVLGRTWATPHSYYYRRLENGRRWTPWEKADVDIQGDHLIPVIWNRRLHIFWPLFTVKADPPTADERASNQDPQKYMNIQIAWSEYKQGKWLPKKMLANDEFLTTAPPTPPTGKLLAIPRITYPALDFPLDPSQYIFKAAIRQEGAGQETLAIQCMQSATAFEELQQLYGMGIGEFQFSDCGGGGKIVPFTFSQRSLPIPERDQIDFMTWEEVEHSGDDDGLYMLQADESSTEVLQQTPGTFSVLYPHQYDSFSSQDAWFYEDEQRTYFVQTSRSGEEAWPTWFNSGDFLHSNKIDPGIIGAALARPYAIVAPPGSPRNVIEASRGGHHSSPTALAAINGTGEAMRATIAPVRTTASLVSSIGSINWPWLGHYYTYYTFTTFYHPYVCDFIRRLNRGGIDELLLWSPPDSANPTGPTQLDTNLEFFQPTYQPLAVDGQYPQEFVDFTYGTPYADYNWELFFHAPLRIATRLSQNQRFDEAMKWFHYIFDPTRGYDDPGLLPDVQQRVRYWKVKALRDEARKIPTTLQQLLVQLGTDGELADMVKDWKDHPFSPYLIARKRLVAFQHAVVMKYIDTLIAAGDQLFHRAISWEDLNKAMMFYINADEILGPKPQQIAPAVTTSDQMTYNQLVKQGLNAATNPLIALENLLLPEQDGGQLEDGSLTRVVIGSGKALFFCIPANDKLLQYWDTVADRLFKIRHCQNIEGVAQQFPPFGPPIDPGLLVSAAAAGIDLNTALTDINAALPHYRFATMIQKAMDLCADLRSLGAALLAALEKHDAEELALLRSSQEVQVLTAVRQVKQQQINEANATLAGLERYQTLVTARQTYYTTLLKQGILPSEQAHLDNLKASWELQESQAGLEVLAAILHLIPDEKVGFDVGVTYGGSNIAAGLQSFGSSMGAVASMLSTQGTISVTQAGYARRTDEWNHQVDLANKELDQVKKQIDAANIRLQIALNELDNHDLQIQNAKDVDDYLRNQKFTNVDLYDWMVGQISAVYFQSYQFAFDIAKRAEQAYSYEIADPNASFIHFGYWDNLKMGLLAGEKLHQDLRRMEMAYLDQNRREFEITKHIALSQLDPMALLMLKQTGSCFVSLPEPLFDADYPRHYLRRIKTVSLSIPCVAGPYTSVNCTLTLLWNSIRQQNTVTTSGNFRDNVGAIQSIVTSSGQTDSGMFDLNFHDERYLPFEGAGCISDWHIELPLDTNAFDFDTITEVVIHLRYTARDGGDTLKKAARDSLRLAPLPPAISRKEPPPVAPLARLFSCKHEFSNEWYRFLHPGDTALSQALSLDLSITRFPFQLRNRQQDIQITAMRLFLELKDEFTHRKDFSYDNVQPLPFTLRNEKYPSTDPPTYVRFSTSFQTGTSPFAETLLVDPHFKGALYAEPVQHHDSADPAGSQDGNVGTWILEVQGADVAKLELPDPSTPSLQLTVAVNGQDYHHLNPEAIADIWIVCEYSTK